MDFTFDNTNIKEKLREIAGEYEKVLKEIKQKRYELIKVSKELDSLWLERYLYYKNDFPISLKQNEIKDFIERDKEYIELKYKLKELENDIEYLEKHLKNIESFRWDIKLFIEWQKLEMGI